MATAGRKLVKGVNDGVGFAMSKKGKMVLKCSFAYFLGSLATSVVLRNWILDPYLNRKLIDGCGNRFVAPIAAMLGRYDGKHMVCTRILWIFGAV